jgi:predicted amidohydrolase YtcJ
LSHEEKERGSLEPGKSADLVVLDRNLFALPPEEIHGARVLLTLLEGKEVYRDPGFRR